MHAVAYAPFENQLQPENNKYGLSLNSEQSINRIEIQVMQQLKEEYGDAIYRSWLLHLKFEKIINDELIITAPTRFIREWISNNYLDHINRILCSAVPAIKKLTIKVRDHLPLLTNSSNTNYVPQTNNKCNIFGFTIDPNLIFKNFIVDESNKIAYDTATAFAGNKQVIYFISKAMWVWAKPIYCSQLLLILEHQVLNVK